MPAVACKETLEQKADRLYNFIHDYLKENAKPPSHKEMAEGLHISRETVARALNLLEEQERPIHRVRGRGRQVWVPLNQQPEED